jgi:hypothetical protein
MGGQLYIDSPCIDRFGQQMDALFWAIEHHAVFFDASVVMKHRVAALKRLY